MIEQSSIIAHLHSCVFEDIYQASGLPGYPWLRRLLEKLARSPVQRFARLAAGFDAQVAQGGFPAAARWLLPRFISRVETYRAENIPPEGPLLIAANHPGLYDALLIAACLPRSDFKIIATGLSFIRSLPFTARHLIYFQKDAATKMLVLRSAIRHLKEGGALLIFPTGRIDPDPAHFSIARRAPNPWSASVELIMNRVRQTRLVLAMVSGVLSADCLAHPLARLRKGWLERQKLAEFIQVFVQMFAAQQFGLVPRLSFSQPYTRADLAAIAGVNGTPAHILPAIVCQAESLLDDHLSR